MDYLLPTMPNPIAKAAKKTPHHGCPVKIAKPANPTETAVPLHPAVFGVVILNSSKIERDDRYKSLLSLTRKGEGKNTLNPPHKKLNSLWLPKVSLNHDGI